MEEQYRNELDRLCLTEESKEQLIQSLSQKHTETGKSHRMKRLPLLAVLLVGLLVCSAVAVTLPVLRTQFEGAGYTQSAATVGKSLTKNGWTLTITDCVGDDRYLYLGLEVSAPTGVVLDAEGYMWDDCDVSFPELEDYLMAWGCPQVKDDMPGDNRIQFIYEIEGGMGEKGSFNGQRMDLTLGKLYHLGIFEEDKQEWSHLYDFPGTWTFKNLQISYPDNAIRLTPHVTIPILQVEAEVTALEVTPIGVVVTIEGDTLKGHHTWVPKDAPDGWYGCMDTPEISLYDKNGRLLEPNQETAAFGVRAGSGCWGGQPDSGEPGRLRLVQSYGYLLDMDNLDAVEICGVRFPLPQQSTGGKDGGA